MVDVEVRLYGAFREYSEQSSLRFSLSPGSDLNDLRAVLRAQLEILKPGSHPGDLLEKSVFADAEDILQADYRLVKSQNLSVIPPVCGG